MQANAPSTGDVLTLSQVAWRTGRAFASGRKNAPREFIKIEAELHGLAKALRIFAEALSMDGVETVLVQAESGTRAGVTTILDSCKRTLEDLDSLVDQYQVIKKNHTSSGYTVERSWSDLVVRNYMSMIWTTEGGTIQELKEILKLHTSTVSLTRQAMQSKSPERVERVVVPISEKLQALFDISEVELHVKIEDLKAVVADVAGRTPTLNANLDSLARVTSTASDLSKMSLQTSEAGSSGGMSRQSPLPTPMWTPEIPANDHSQISTHGTPSNAGLRPVPMLPESVSGTRPVIAGPAYTTIPGHSPGTRQAGSARFELLSRTPQSPGAKSSSRGSASEGEFPRLPPSAIEGGEDEIAPAPRREVNFAPLVGVEQGIIHGSTSTRSQQERFEKTLFKDSAILCDVRGQSIEFTQSNADNERNREVSLELAMKDCRICLVRRREVTVNGYSYFPVNVWAFNDDLTVRMQQKLPDDVEIIPYTSYFQSAKVSITIPTELVFHDVSYGTKPLRNTRTEWINYVLEDTEAAAEFQAALYGRKLINSFKTEKTLRLHEGITHVITFQEQMCAMENLRLWEDVETAAVIGMIHFSAQFRRGYLLFYLNSKDNPLRVRDEGGKAVKIKGLKIPIADAPPRGKSRTERRTSSDSKKLISGAKIEFASETEKEEFISVVQTVQRRMVGNLPELKC